MCKSESAKAAVHLISWNRACDKKTLTSSIDKCIINCCSSSPTLVNDESPPLGSSGTAFLRRYK